MTQQISPSARLNFRRLVPADAGFMLQLLNTPGWLANIGDRGVRTEAQALGYLEERIFPNADEPPFGPFAMYLNHAPEQLIGTVGIYKRPGLELPDIGYALLPDHENQGYATEGAKHLLEFAQVCGVSELSAITLPQNEPSAAILRRLAFELVGQVTLPGETDRLDQWLWRAA